MNIKEKILGDITAYAFAIRGGYRGTQKEFEQMLANLGVSMANLQEYIKEIDAGEDVVDKSVEKHVAAAMTDYVKASEMSEMTAAEIQEQISAAYSEVFA